MLTKEQVLAIRCAFADLSGAYQVAVQQDYSCHDWRCHYQTMKDLKEAFPDILTDQLLDEDADLH
jgi:hypothetical protein